MRNIIKSGPSCPMQRSHYKLLWWYLGINHQHISSCRSRMQRNWCVSLIILLFIVKNRFLNKYKKRHSEQTLLKYVIIMAKLSWGKLVFIQKLSGSFPFNIFLSLKTHDRLRFIILYYMRMHIKKYNIIYTSPFVE